MSKLVSVAICTYNGEKYIDEQITSVLAQKGVDLEVIVCDDQSTDSTWARLESWPHKDSRVSVQRNPQRLGYSKNFAQTIALCRGEFIAPCDQDDIWLPDKLARLVSAIDAHLMSYCDSLLVDEHGHSLNKKVSDRLGMYQGTGVIPLCFWNSISGHAMLFHRSLITLALPLPEGCFHDWWLAAVAASYGSINFVPEALVHYRQHANSQTDIIRKRKSRSNSWRLYDQRAKWLNSLARLPGPDQKYCIALTELWDDRKTQWFCPALFKLLMSKSTQLMLLNRHESALRFAFKQFLGQRWRQRAQDD